jgi:hypothetical protein
MALDEGKSGLIYLTIKGLKKDAEKIYIEKYEGKNVEGKHYKSVEGNLVKITFPDKEYESKKYKGCCIYLKDKDETYVLKSGFDKITNIIRSILNQILNLKSFDNIKITVKGGENDYKNAWVSQNDNKAGFYLSLDEINALIEKYTINGDTVKSYSKLDERFIELVELSINSVLNCKNNDIENNKPEIKDNKVVDPIQSLSDEDDSNIDNLPF